MFNMQYVHFRTLCERGGTKVCFTKKYVLSFWTGSSSPVSNVEVITIANPSLHITSVVLEYRGIHWRTSKNRGSELHRDETFQVYMFATPDDSEYSVTFYYKIIARIFPSYRIKSLLDIEILSLYLRSLSS